MVNVKQLSKDTYSFVNGNTVEGTTYAWYVIDKKNAKPLYKSEYSTDSAVELTFKDKGEYLVKSYSKSENGRYRCSEIVADIKYNSQKKEYENVTNKFPWLNLVYQGQTVKDMGDSKYNFKVNFQYSWNYKIKWYIYRNGGYYTSFTEENIPNITYQFKEPGRYTVMYYLTTSNGDNEFWNFDEIHIE